MPIRRVIPPDHVFPSAFPTVGLLAGWGDYPIVVAKSLRAAGFRIHGIGILDHADPQLENLCDEFAWIGLGGIGRAIRIFQRWGISQATMAGKIHKVVFHQPGWWIRHWPDWKAVQTFSSQFLFGTEDCKDDSLLVNVVNAFAKEGILFEPATKFAPELLVHVGHQGGPRLKPRQQRDVLFGWEIAKQLGAMDVGQTVCVKNQTVIAMEAIEGTDQCIARAGELCQRGGFVVVKVAKPQQDMRFDVPTVGIDTLEAITAAGGSVLAMEAHRTILLDQRDFSQTARKLKISVTAWEPAEIRKACA